MDGKTARQKIISVLSELREALRGTDREAVTVTWNNFKDLVHRLNAGELKEDIVPYETWFSLASFSNDGVWIQRCPIPAYGAWLNKVDSFIDDFGGRVDNGGRPTKWNNLKSLITEYPSHTNQEIADIYKKKYKSRGTLHLNQVTPEKVSEVRKNMKRK